MGFRLCQRWCDYYKGEREETERCLASELLNFWQSRDPRVASALESLGAVDAGEINDYSVLEDIVCQFCVFRSHGCDFAARPADGLAPPCGALKVLAHLVKRSGLSRDDLKVAWDNFKNNGYLRLAEHAVLRHLEAPYLYDRVGDELYELNDEAYAFLGRCDGVTPGLGAQCEPEFLDFVLKESLLACQGEPRWRKLQGRSSPVPSLRYLELMLTERCNLRCLHCYLGQTGATDLPLADTLAILRQFEEMQGLRVLLSGGEPLLYPWWEELNRHLSEFELRFVLLTNGVLLTEEVLSRLRVQEIQISLDGLEAGHDRLRGRGTWSKATAHLQAAREFGFDLSVATMIYAGNLHELEDLGRLLQQWQVKEWSLDVPCATGRWPAHPELMVSPEVAAPLLELGFGSSRHTSEEGFACGHHLAAVLPSGQVAKCGLYAHHPLGHWQEGLETCWRRLSHVPLKDLECAPCPHLEECQGGCRFRAGEGLAPDPVMCARYGVDPARFRKQES